ncbi:tripartite tricarboxylate transporter permease [Bradyrhizobium sp. LHD-71]|uniref:tripartite tricarboxylate transporter permease n=1 Tax=Bradyrhizobium sp. LHD-71 TaxID=3072141 RepID=UPI00280D699D|nr:tripartite tricarboxylate transporter permease [Bradyrhizobium sp. LHD-71]MDQ8729203.1 tripartite tricarboxylate transporter permease [Bradyrhizobium sp. LHD-71]
MLDNLALGFETAFTISNLLYCLIGVTLGTAIGVLPGVGPIVTISVLLPLTFGLPPEGALIMLSGIYYGAQYGGSTTAILVNLPGESSSVVTCIDGYQMARQGRAGAALAVAAIGSLVAGCIGTLLLAFFAPLLTSVALDLSAPEYCSLMFLSLCCTASLVPSALLKGLVMALTGVLFGMVGTDVYSGLSRFTFGVPGLGDGIDFVIVAMGMFAFSEIISNLVDPEERKLLTTRVEGLMIRLEDLKESWKSMLRGAGVGSLLGIIPGAGVSVASFVAYVVEKKIARDPSRFGNGAIEGVAGPEAANNGAAQASFIPTLSLGIPGSPTMALILGALMIQGITPGPDVVTSHPKLFWGLVVSMLIGNVLLVLLNLPLIGVWIRMLKVPYRWLYPGILVFSCVGILTINMNPLDVALAALFGLVGYIFVKLDYPPAPFILGFVLGPMIEENLRRALLFSEGSYSIFVTRPISAFFLVLTALLFVSILVQILKGGERAVAIGGRSEP